MLSNLLIDHLSSTALILTLANSWSEKRLYTEQHNYKPGSIVTNLVGDWANNLLKVII